tara:strand:+ start:78 stop:386 length:309 start_codon:yes stop_codon:yes gene_type:complete
MFDVRTAQIIVGYFVTHNRRAISGAAKHLRMNPSEMLQQAYYKMGKKKPITAYKDKYGNPTPIGTKSIAKPKTDPQDGSWDKYHQKQMDDHMILKDVDINFD